MREPNQMRTVAQTEIAMYARVKEAERERDEARELHAQICANFGQQTSDMLHMSREIDRLNVIVQDHETEKAKQAYGHLCMVVEDSEVAEAVLIDELRHLPDKTIDRLAMSIIDVPVMARRKLIVKNVIMTLAAILEEDVR